MCAVGRPPGGLRLALAALALAATAGCARGEPAWTVAPETAPRRAEARTPSGLRIVALRTGWVGITEPHWRWRAPGFFVVPRIFLTRTWHPWLPIIVYAIVAGREVVLVDTGPAPEIADPAYMACDTNNQFFYARNMRFVVDPADAVDRQLPGLGIAPDAVSTVVVTHFHGDHTGRLGAFPRARVVTGRGNWPSHLGAVPCTWPPGLAPAFPRFADGAVGAFAESERLTADGAVRVVPLLGHTPGHVGVLVADGGRYWLMAGDATFDLEQTRAGDVAGVSEGVAEARRTQARIATQLAGFDTVLLPAHDLAAFGRLETSAVAR